jgi:membrane glycosyltransferase
MGSLTKIKPGEQVAAFLPPPAPIDVPVQSLRVSPTKRRAFSPRLRMVLRRLVLFSLTIVMTAAVGQEMYQVLEVAGLTRLESVTLGLFVLLFAWIALSFISAAIGAMSGQSAELIPVPHRVDLLPDLQHRVAIILPTYNEEPRRIMARLQAIYESVQATGRGASFDFFVLSDTTDPGIWVAEEAAYLDLIDGLGDPPIFYRHRAQNTGRKAGNISEWLERFGGHYESMVVLDADSLMEGDTIVGLAAAMEAHPDVGLIQTLPVIINADTLFARLQQFAGRIYGPAIARGVAWWHGPDGNYWGHNAIIRVRAFAQSAGLPNLKGRKPFGGHILSHDFVEAALMRRSGWKVCMAPNLGGSFEESPPTLTDFVVRDRRWCQGNLQHTLVLPARGLHWLSRFHFVTGIFSYLSSPLWFLFLLLGVGLALQAQYVRPEYFSPNSLYPQWPAQDPVRAIWVFAITMLILLLPKILATLVMALRSESRKKSGGGFRLFAGMIVETILSGLLAPITMIFQSRAVLEVLLGRDTGWSAQRRAGGAGESVGTLFRLYAAPFVIGLALALGAFLVSSGLFYWMTPVLIGLVFCVPLVWLTSSAAAGSAFRYVGLLATPEEIAPPAVLTRARELESALGEDFGQNAVARLREDVALRHAHISQLPISERREPGTVDEAAVIALAKLETCDSVEQALTLLSPAETRAVLGNRRVLEHFLA